ncbi:MAG: hypothetical protein L0Z50_36935 [Verrucomicrobiales bacterium]|nr:hypothetical protein [Verrucomicrobiales bacterium]
MQEQKKWKLILAKYMTYMISLASMGKKTTVAEIKPPSGVRRRRMLSVDLTPYRDVVEMLEKNKSVTGLSETEVVLRALRETLPTLAKKWKEELDKKFEKFEQGKKSKAA